MSSMEGVIKKIGDLCEIIGILVRRIIMRIEVGLGNAEKRLPYRYTELWKLAERSDSHSYRSTVS
jgi:hypothetical protein